MRRKWSTFIFHTLPLHQLRGLLCDFLFCCRDGFLRLFLDVIIKK
jgi:hypothetical protein